MQSWYTWKTKNLQYIKSTNGALSETSKRLTRTLHNETVGDISIDLTHAYHIPLIFFMQHSAISCLCYLVFFSSYQQYCNHYCFGTFANLHLYSFMIFIHPTRCHFQYINVMYPYYVTNRNSLETSTPEMVAQSSEIYIKFLVTQ